MNLEVFIKLAICECDFFISYNTSISDIVLLEYFCNTVFGLEDFVIIDSEIRRLKNLK